jgi:hypothetical protein
MDSGVVLAGARGRDVGGRAHVARLDGEARPIWMWDPQGPGESLALQVEVDRHGLVRALVIEGMDDAAQAVLVSFDGRGEVERRWVSECGDVMALAPDGGIAMGFRGELRGGPITVCRYDAGMRLRWRIDDDRPGSTFLGAPGLAFDRSGNVLVSGFSYQGVDAEPTEMWVRKYTDEGRLLWDDGYAGNDGRFGYSFDVAADLDGNVATVGMIHGSAAPAIAVRKIAP